MNFFILNFKNFALWVSYFWTLYDTYSMRHDMNFILWRKSSYCAHWAASIRDSYYESTRRLHVNLHVNRPAPLAPNLSRINIETFVILSNFIHLICSLLPSELLSPVIYVRFHGLFYHVESDGGYLQGRLSKETSLGKIRKQRIWSHRKIFTCIR